MTAEDKAKNAGKVALVLEGGSFRGQFTAGVLDVLMEAGVEIPAVYGVSAGALNCNHFPFSFQHSVNGVQYIDQGVWSMRIVHNGGVAFR